MKPAFERAKVELMTPELFEAMCREHDLTYVYSDDGRAYDAGCAEHKAIEAAAKVLSAAVAAPIWNKVVRAKILPEGQSIFLWSLP